VRKQKIYVIKEEKMTYEKTMENVEKKKSEAIQKNLQTNHVQ